MTREEYINNIFTTYDLVSVLSNKNECCVYRLRHKELKKDLVLRSYKEYLPAYDALVSINCKNLPLVYDSIILEDGHIVLEEFISSITLAEYLEVESLRYKGAKNIIKGVCNALSVLHSLGIVHRDVKPENIVLDHNGRVVLIDFNVSRFVKNTKRDTVIMGTVGYASPEQLGFAQSDARTDIYATGVLLNVILTGKHPSETIVGGKAGHIVRKCTAISPDDRYKNAESLFLAL